MNNSSSGNILLVANWESDVGYAWWLMEGFWLAISRYYSKQGLTSILIYPKITAIPASISSSRIRVLEHNFNKITPGNMARLRSIIKEHNIKYIYLTDAAHYSWVYPLLKIWGVKNILVHVHTPGERSPPGFLIKSLKKVIFSLPFFSADKFLAVTDFVGARLVNASCVPEHKVACVSNGIIPIDLSASEKNYAHTHFEIAPDKVIVVTTGRATFYKGIDFFIDCANALINTHKKTEFHFLYCGDGPDLNAFKEMVHQYHIENSFTFAGKRNDIREILPSCHIGLHAAIGEVGYSLSILEYMSAGLLSVVPDKPSVSGATINNVNGLLYQDRNINSCVEKILQYHDSRKTDLLRMNAVNAVKEKFNLQHTHKLLIDSITPLI